jgi:hypothetical protein
MKRAALFTLTTVAILALIAWGWSNSKSNSSTISSTTKTTSMSPILELAVGTLRLEGTSQAIDKELATQLLPYWQLLDELNASESTAPQEITAVVENIQGIMTEEQVKAIQDLQLTQSDLAAAVQDGGSEAGTTTAKIINVSQVTGGGGPAGGPPDAGGILMDGGGPGISSGSSQQSTSSAQGTSSATTASLIEEVIKLLEKRINS